ncbi:helix-turn-helix transcriptional regulator [Microbacterium marinilacus]|nr:LuxR family transcriptional regulator [Microbacterium marinilacus]MBY0687550.1 LuxR C-terminal-related transcriptional regulator [Microbacterium marinilacus]
MAQQAEDPRVSAIFRALAAGDHERAIALAERHWSFLSSFRGEVRRAVADEVLRAHPSWAVVRQGLRHAALGRLRPTVWVAPDLPLPPGSSANERIVALTARAMAARSRGRLDEALGLTAQARQLLRAATPRDLEGGRFNLAEVHQEWAQISAFAGHADDAVVLFERAFSLATELRHPRAAMDAAAELAWLAAVSGRRGASLGWLLRLEQLRADQPDVRGTRESDRIARALLLLDELDLAGARSELAAIEDAREHELLRRALGALVDAHDPLCDPDTALAHLNGEIEAVYDGWTSARLNAVVLGAARSRLLQRSGQPERALRALPDAQPSQELSFEAGRAASLLHLLGEHERASSLTSRILAAPTLSPRVRADALVARAAIELRRGDDGRAAETFSRALRVIDEHRLLVALTIVPADELRALGAVLPAADPGARLARHVVDTSVAFPSAGLDHRLTARERTVLSLLAGGLTVVEAAARLTVSANTVKTQVRSLYRKLGVHDRQGLSVVARTRGLL